MKSKIPSFLYCWISPSLIGIAFLLILFSGCENSSNANSAGEALHSCELFTAAEIESIIGAKTDTPPRETHKVDDENNFWMSMCNYYAPDSGVSLGIMIQPLSPPGSPEKAYEVYVDSLKSSLPDYEVTPAEGIGKKAIWSEDTGQLTIFSDKHMVLITSMKPGASGEEKLTLAKNVGLKTLEKTQ